jgi:hypothetical protein
MKNRISRNFERSNRLPCERPLLEMLYLGKSEVRADLSITGINGVTNEPK